MSGDTKIRDGQTNTSPKNFAKVTNKNLHVAINDSEGNQAIVDSMTGGLPVLEYEHHEIHEGDHYFIDIFDDIANGGIYELLLVTPNTTKWIHLVYEYLWQTEGEFELFEGVATDADGTVVPNFNNNRNSLNTAGMVVTHTPTNPTGGTSFSHNQIGNGKSIGGSRRADQEKILKPNTKYLMRASNQTIGFSNLFNIQLDWYEHTNLV